MLPNTTAGRLRFMAARITGGDPIVGVLSAAADAWEAGDRGPLVTAVVAFADDLWDETMRDVEAR